jgi:ATP-dependent protease HslVU (ClpYQ) peptidase subunit
MTTIFADAKKGVMVCESKMTLGSTWFSSSKVQRIGGDLVGFAGLRSEALKWLDWFSNGKRGPQPKITNSEALILSSEGLVYIDGSGESNPIERGFMGVGSGGPYAVAAFMAGADAKKSVEIACLIDAASGGQVHIHKLKA